MEQTKYSSIETLPSDTIGLPMDSSSASEIEGKEVSLTFKDTTPDDLKVNSPTTGVKNLSSSSSFKPLRSLVEILLEINSFPEFLARSVFKGVLKELEKLYSQKCYHGNLALENIFLTWDHEIILSDPVAEEKSFAEGVLVDMFCLGEILFSLLAGFLPFASEDDPNFVAFLEANWGTFWSSHEKTLVRPHLSGNFFKSELRDLLTSLLSMGFDPEQIATQLNEHAWSQGAEISLKQTGELLLEVRKKMSKKN